jgi:xanthine dehydrogenase small subunit
MKSAGDDGCSASCFVVWCVTVGAQTGTSHKSRAARGGVAGGPWLDATLVDSRVMRESISFVLNGRLETLRSIPPATTLLDYLRKTKRLTGTKEGCAEGDCGACTVVVGELRGGKVRYRAVNACIVLLPMLEGRSVTTVEHLRGDNGGLHPVQQALVDAHGSQCGFCTPGFVMSLYATYLSERRPGVGRIDDILAGNLCRCTGYSAIYRSIEAAATTTRKKPTTIGRNRRDRKDRRVRKGVF